LQFTLLRTLEMITSKYDGAKNKVSKSIYIILKIARNANQMTQEAASAASGVSKIYLAELEVGKKENISAGYLEKLSKAYNISMEQVMHLADYYDQLEEAPDRKYRLTLIEALEIIDSNLNK